MRGLHFGDYVKLTMPLGLTAVSFLGLTLSFTKKYNTLGIVLLTTGTLLNAAVATVETFADVCDEHNGRNPQTPI